MLSPYITMTNTLQNKEEETTIESWIPRLSELCYSLAENRPNGKTGEIGSFRAIATLFRQELSSQKKQLLSRVLEEVIKQDEDNTGGMVNGVSIHSDPDLAFGRGYRNLLRSEQRKALTTLMEE